MIPVAESIIVKEFVCVRVSKSVTRNANASYSEEIVTYDRPSGYKVVSVTTTMQSSEFMHPLLVYIGNTEGKLTYMINNTHSVSLTRYLIANVILQKS